MPVVSVIVPVYNTEKWLGDCIESILKQTFKDFELLLIDDGSQDHSRKICELYAQKDGRIQIIHQKNGGVSKARNLGLSLSSGKYISFVDSDDQIERDFLQKAIDICDEKQVDIYMAGMLGIEKGGKKSQAVVNKMIHVESSNFAENQMIELLEQNYIASCCGKVFLKKIINDTRFKESCVFGEDLMFVYDILKKNVNVFVDNYIGYNYFKRNNSLITTTNLTKCRDIVKTYTYLFGTVDELNYCSGEYAKFLQKRCAMDIQVTQRSILNGKDSIKQKYKMLKTLLENKEIVDVLKGNLGKTRLGKYSFCPFVILAKHYCKLKNGISK